jgi:GH25 family lysozyme M1 (1,4-beta-N-acetylmuramidase)
METNDGSQYRVVTDPAAYMAARPMYVFRAASARNGAMYIDTAFDRHRTGLAAMPLLVMYQYVYPQWSAEQQADFFCNAIGEARGNETAMLDIETAAAIPDPAGFARVWLARVEERLGCRSWIYIPGPLAGPLVPVAGGRVIMAPRYSGTAQRGAAPTWQHDVHQYTDRGYFPGCPDPAGGDTSYTALTLADLIARSRPVPPNTCPGGSLDGT